MTCIDAYLRDHPGVASYYAIKTHNKLPGGCPGGYGYLDDPSWCNTDGTKCYLCWLREIPENEEKENENMSDAVTINYEARCEQLLKENESLKELIHQKDVALLASMNQHAEDEERIKNLLHERNMYRYGLHVVEAFLGRDILEED